MISPQRSTDLLERLFVAVVIAAAVTAGAFLGVSRVAAALFGHGTLRAGVPDAAAALTHLPGHLSDPAGAWPDPQRATLPGPVAYWTVLLLPLAVVGAAGAIGFGAYHRRRKARRQPLGVDPDVGVATRLRRLEVTGPAAGRITLGRVGDRLVAAEAGASVAVIGPSGCGKTVGFAIPALLEWNGPVVATSVKTDLLAATYEQRRAMGSVWIYDPTGCSRLPAARWSPLPDCATWGGAQRVAAWLCAAAEPKRSSVSDADYWQNQGQLALAPLLHAAATSAATMADVVRWVDMQEVEMVRQALADAAGLPRLVAQASVSPDALRLTAELEGEIRRRAIEDLRRLLLADGSSQARRAAKSPNHWPAEWRERLEDKIAADLGAAVAAELEVILLRKGGRCVAPLAAAEALWAKEDKLRSSVYATVQNVLLGYSDNDVADAADGCDIDLGRWLTGPNTIYIVADHDDQDRLRPVLTVLLAAAVRAAYHTANRNGGTLRRPCLALLDEAGNVAAPKDLPAWTTTARSHGISLITIWQDLAQLRVVYGDLGNVILNNHKAKVFGSGISDPTTLDLASRLVGDRVVKEWNQNKSGQGDTSWSEHTTYRRAAPGDTVRRLDSHDALLVYGNQPPARLGLRPPPEATQPEAA